MGDFERLRREEPLDEAQGDIGDSLPSRVDDEGVAAVLDFFNFGDSFVAALTCERHIRDGPRDRVILFARDDFHWPTRGVLRVNSGFRRWVDVRERRLKERNAGAGHGEFVVETPSFGYVNGRLPRPPARLGGIGKSLVLTRTLSPHLVGRILGRLD